MLVCRCCNPRAFSQFFSNAVCFKEMLPRGRGQAQLLMQYQHSAMARSAAGGRFGCCFVHCVVFSNFVRRSGYNLSDSKRQVETAGTFARVLRLLLTKNKEKQQRQAMKTSDQSPNGQLRTLSLGANGDISSKLSSSDKSPSEQSPFNHTDILGHDDDDDLSLQHTLPDMIQACRSSRLQLISLAPHLLEESAHTSNSDVRSCSYIEAA